MQEHLVCLLNDMDKVTIIIDQADLAFTISPDTKVEDTMTLRNALALFTMFTEEKNKIWILHILFKHINHICNRMFIHSTSISIINR